MALLALLYFFLRFGVPVHAALVLAAVLAKVAPQYRPAKGEIVDRES
jgi:hypothetical protein